MMSENQAKIVSEAYIKPVRNVVILDDQFRNYRLLVDHLLSAKKSVLEGAADMTTTEPKDLAELERAAQLWSECRSRGWSCDIESQIPSQEREERKVTDCDLLVLDYHLDGTDPRPALMLLRKISTANRFSLVVLYTIDGNLGEVHTRVAAYLRGCRGEGQFEPETIDKWEDIEEADVEGKITLDDIHDLISGGVKRHGSSPLADMVRRYTPDSKLAAGVVDLILENYIRQKILSNDPEISTANLDKPTRLSALGQELRWVQHGNAFVAIVSKKTHRGADVFDALADALRNWAPSALHLILAFARDRIASGGHSLDTSVLHDDALRTAWVYHAIVSGGDHGISELVRRLIDSVGEEIAQDITDFASSLLKDETGNVKGSNSASHDERLEVARGVALPEGAGSSEQQVFMALNTYLCSDTFRGRHVTTGTVLRDSENRYWLCASPACDLVPEQTRKKISLRDELRPWIPATFILGADCDPGVVQKNAQRNRWIFFKDGSDRRLVQILGDDGTPQLRLFYLENEGIPARGQVRMAFLGKGDLVPAPDDEVGRDGPVVRTITAVPVAQLRPAYSSLFLQAVGTHGSRIGVDFRPFRGTSQNKSMPSEKDVESASKAEKRQRAPKLGGQEYEKVREAQTSNTTVSETKLEGPARKPESELEGEALAKAASESSS